MQVDAFHRGDMDALARAADLCVQPVWRVATTGFTLAVDDLPTHVEGMKSQDDAVVVTQMVVAAVMTPDRRSAVTTDDELVMAALAEARDQLLKRALATGRAHTIASGHEAAQVPAGTPDLDRALATGQPPAPGDHLFLRTTDEPAVDVCHESVAALDERSQRLVDLRWRQGKTARDIADIFTCGTAAVLAHERRVRRRVQRTLLKRFPDGKFGPATQDLLLSRATGAPHLPAVTVQRLRSEILKRTFQEEPAPYRVRLAWGLGAAAVAFGLWLLMFARVLPYYGDDVYPSPTVAVDCDGACRAGETGRISVLAPNDARFVAIMLTDATGRVWPLLTGPSGGAVRLPFGARGGLVPMPYPATWPAAATGTATVTAVFAPERLDPEVPRAVVAGQRGGVLTSSAAVRIVP